MSVDHLRTLADGHLAGATVALPGLAGALIVLLVRRGHRATAYLAGVGGLLGLVAAVGLLVRQLRGMAPTVQETLGDLPTGGPFAIPLQLQVGDLVAVVAVAVALVSLVIQLFTVWYLADDRRYRVFAATVGLFTTGMQLVVLSGDVLLIIVGWEIMGWCSYLLIGHDSGREAARRAAFKAFMVTRFADAPFFIGLIALAIGARSTQIHDILRHWAVQGAGDHGTALTVALICVICGVAGKSAQVPFQDWLPDAMEGPTPASALIHAATMVAAGTIVLARLTPLLVQSDVARAVLLVVASASTVLAGAVAFLQQDLKRLLAWSTISQVGLMLLAVSLAPPGTDGDLGVLHLLSHAMFKSLLFLALGWLTVLVGGTVVPRMSGSLLRHPAVSGYMGVGLLALAGVPPLSGFATKDLIIDEAARQGAEGDRIARIGFIVLVVMVALTTAYCMRAWLIFKHQTIAERQQAAATLEDSYDIEDVGIAEILETSPQVDERGHEIVPEVPVAMPEVIETVEAPRRPGWPARFGMGVLSLLTICGGAIIFVPFLDLDWRGANLWLVGATLMLMAGVAVLVRVMSLGTIYGDAAERVPRGIRTSGIRGLGADTAYVALVGRPVIALAGRVAALDGLLDRGVLAAARGLWALAVRGLAAHDRRPTSGAVALAGGLIVVGVLGVALW